MGDQREPTTCKHCGDRIVPTRLLDRDRWTHQPAGAAFMDSQHEFCHRTIATPAATKDASACAHGWPESDCPSCAACAACDGGCGTCPYFAARPAPLAQPDATASEEDQR